MWTVYCDQPGIGAAGRKRTYFAGPRWWTSDVADAAHWHEERAARYVMETYAFDHRRSTARHDYLYGLEEVEILMLSDKPSSREEALNQVRWILAELGLEPADRDRLFGAVVEYGHACASEVLADCRRLLEGLSASG